MRCLLDSNILIGLMENRPISLRLRVREALPGDAVTSSIVMHELIFGAFNSARVDDNLRRISKLTFPVLEFDASDARAAGEIRADLRRRGTPIGPYDLLIAGQALARGLTLVSGNFREFSRVAGLRIENWLEA